MAKVPKTSGQGVSRKSYQTAYRLGQHGAGSGLKTEKVDTPSSGGGSRDYAKAGALPKINVSYGNTIEPGTAEEVPLPEPKTAPVRILPPKKWKG